VRAWPALRQPVPDYRRNQIADCPVLFNRNRPQLRHCGVCVMSGPVAEARIAVESAIAVAEIVAHHEVVESLSFRQLVVYLHDAVEALAKAEGEPPEPQHTIFPTQEAANDHLASIKPATDIAYRLSRSGDGKCVIQVFRLSGLL
jgi:hypothetical protein